MIGWDDYHLSGVIPCEKYSPGAFMTVSFRFDDNYILQADIGSSSTNDLALGITALQEFALESFLGL